MGENSARCLNESIIGNVVDAARCDIVDGEERYCYNNVDKNGNRTRYRYDERSDLLKVTNPEGNTRSYSYNESGKPVQMEDYDGGILSIEYNAMGKPEKLTDKEGREIRRTYNKMGKHGREEGHHQS